MLSTSEGQWATTSRRTLGLCLEHGIGLVTLVPRTCAIRQELEAWGRQHPALPLLVEKPGRTKAEEPRRWHGHSVLRRVEVEDSMERVTQEEVRFVVVHSSQLAQQHARTYVSAQEKEAEAVADHVRQVHAQWFACRPDAEAAIAAYGGQGPAAAGAGRAPGGITRSAIASWQRVAARAVPVGVVLRRQPRRRPRRAMASWSRWTPCPMLRSTMGGQCWPPRYVLRGVRTQRFSKPIRSKIPP